MADQPRNWGVVGIVSHCILGLAPQALAGVGNQGGVSPDAYIPLTGIISWIAVPAVASLFGLCLAISQKASSGLREVHHRLDAVASESREGDRRLAETVRILGERVARIEAMMERR